MRDKWVEAGLEVYALMRPPEDVERIAEGSARNGFGGAMSELALAFAFGGVWSREGLALRERSLVTIAVLIALRQPDELRKHVKMAISNGLTVVEIREALLQTVPYAGFPAAASAMTVTAAALKEIGIDPDEVM